jgi:hypothetical protein
MAEGTLTRRAVVRGAAAAAAGVASATAGAERALAGHDHDRRHAAPVPPEPIPGGIELPMPPFPTEIIHVWAPGPPDLTLPFTGGTLQGFDVEPTTIRDFKGFSAVAFHVGTATGKDGTRYDFETDVRAFRGTYLDGTGRRRFGTFGFI